MNGSVTEINQIMRYTLRQSKFNLPLVKMDLDVCGFCITCNLLCLISSLGVGVAEVVYTQIRQLNICLCRQTNDSFFFQQASNPPSDSKQGHNLWVEFTYMTRHNISTYNSGRGIYCIILFGKKKHS